jgi:thioredoxin 1
MKKMLELNAKSFNETINNEQPVAVDFWAEWCGPCRMFAPVLEELSDELDGKALFCKLNIDDNAELAQKYDVAMIPTLIVFKDGEPVDRLVGVHPKAKAQELIMKHIADAGELDN